MKTKQVEMGQKRATRREIQVARDYYQTDDIEIDEGAFVSVVPDEGRWIAAWVWVSDVLIEEDDLRKREVK